MHYGIIGIGPVGAVFAAHLKKAGHKLSILEGDPYKIEYLKDNPLTVAGRLTAEAKLDGFCANAAELAAAQPDAVLVCIKGSYTKDVLKEIQEHNIKEETVFVACQNGIDVEDLIAEVFGDHRTLRAVLNFGCNFKSLGNVAVSFNFEHFLSEKEDVKGADQKICKEWGEAGLVTKLVKNYKEEAFKKAILNTALGTPCALTHLTMAEVMEDPEMGRMVREIVREAIKIGKGLGFDMGSDYLTHAIGYLSKGGPHKPSMLVDIENKRKTENEFNAGQLFHYGEMLGIDVPVIQSIYYLVKNLEKSSIRYM